MKNFIFILATFAMLQILSAWFAIELVNMKKEIAILRALISTQDQKMVRF